MKPQMKWQWMQLAVIALFCLFLTASTQAAPPDFHLYGNQGTENITDLNIPEVDTSWFTAVDYFRTGPNEGKMIAATGKFVYMQDSVGGSTWTKVGEVEDTMDPAFIKISPSGTQVALGLGWNQDILVFDASILNATITDLNINPNPNVTVYAANHYDAAWYGESHLVINGGQWVVPGQSAVSGVTSLDVTDPSAISQGLCGNIPGASSSIAIDSNNNLVFGIGAGNDTGQLKVWKPEEWLSGGTPTSTVLNYQASGLVFADSVLSAAHLGFDNEGNLHVGGGEFVNPPVGEVNLESGYAAFISAKVIQDAVDDTVEHYTADESNGEHYREFGPDVCRNDTATGALANGRTLTVVWNPATAPGGANCTVGSNSDWWQHGVAPVATEYKINTTLDSDGDGYLDVADNSPFTNFDDNTDADNDGYGNIIDADFNNDGVVNFEDFGEFQTKYGSADPEVDMNSDGIVNFEDFGLFQQKYGATAPYYNL